MTGSRSVFVAGLAKTAHAVCMGRGRAKLSQVSTQNNKGIEKTANVRQTNTTDNGTFPAEEAQLTVGVRDESKQLFWGQKGTDRYDAGPGFDDAEDDG
jgi:hypothetical protein